MDWKVKHLLKGCGISVGKGYVLEPLPDPVPLTRAQNATAEELEVYRHPDEDRPSYEERQLQPRRVVHDETGEVYEFPNLAEAMNFMNDALEENDLALKEAIETFDEMEDREPTEEEIEKTEQDLNKHFTKKYPSLNSKERQRIIYDALRVVFYGESVDADKELSFADESGKELEHIKTIPSRGKGKITMTKKQFLKEHRNLLKVLKSGDPKKLKREYDEQKTEMMKYVGKGLSKEQLLSYNDRLEEEVEEGDLEDWDLFDELYPKLKEMYPNDGDLMMAELDDMRAKAKGSAKQTLLKSALNTLSRVIGNHLGLYTGKGDDDTESTSSVSGALEDKGVDKQQQEVEQEVKNIRQERDMLGKAYDSLEVLYDDAILDQDRPISNVLINVKRILDEVMPNRLKIRILDTTPKMRELDYEDLGKQADSVYRYPQYDARWRSWTRDHIKDLMNRIQRNEFPYRKEQEMRIERIQQKYQLPAIIAKAKTGRGKGRFSVRTIEVPTEQYAIFDADKNDYYAEDDSIVVFESKGEANRFLDALISGLRAKETEEEKEAIERSVGSPARVRPAGIREPPPAPKRGKGKTHRESFLKKMKLKPDTTLTIEEVAKLSGHPVGILQEVYNRGIGAYKTNPESVRMKGTYKKGVKAPMSKKLSKEQWAMARVYSFVDGNKKHDQDLRFQF